MAGSGGCARGRRRIADQRRAGRPHVRRQAPCRSAGAPSPAPRGCHGPAFAARLPELGRHEGGPSLLLERVVRRGRDRVRPPLGVARDGRRAQPGAGRTRPRWQAARPHPMRPAHARESRACGGRACGGPPRRPASPAVAFTSATARTTSTSSLAQPMLFAQPRRAAPASPCVPASAGWPATGAHDRRRKGGGTCPGPAPHRGRSGGRQRRRGCRRAQMQARPCPAARRQAEALFRA